MFSVPVTLDEALDEALATTTVHRPKRRTFQTRVTYPTVVRLGFADLLILVGTELLVRANAALDICMAILAVSAVNAAEVRRCVLALRAFKVPAFEVDPKPRRATLWDAEAKYLVISDTREVDRLRRHFEDCDSASAMGDFVKSSSRLPTRHSSVISRDILRPSSSLARGILRASTNACHLRPATRPCPRRGPL